MFLLFFFIFFILFSDDVRPPRITQTENYTVWKAIPSQMLYPSNLDLCRRLFPFWMTHANSIDYRHAAARNVLLIARRYINCPLYYLSCIVQYNILYVVTYTNCVEYIIMVDKTMKITRSILFADTYIYATWYIQGYSVKLTRYINLFSLS